MTDIILPIFVLVFAGFLLDKKFKLDLSTLAKLNFYIFVPIFMFMKISQSDASLLGMGWIAIFTAGHIALLLILSWPILSLNPLKKNRPILLAGSLFYNSGNYGIPLVLLVFGDHLISFLAMNILVQNLLTFTLGIFILHAGERSARRVILEFLGMPMFYAIASALLIRYFQIPLPKQLAIPLEYVAAGMVAIALLTLGSQLSRSKMIDRLASVSLTVFFRFVLSPLVAFLFCLFLPLSLETKSMLILVSSLPVAVNVNILAMESGKDPELASQMVFWTTLISGLTVPVFILLLRIS